MSYEEEETVTLLPSTVAGRLGEERVQPLGQVLNEVGTFSGVCVERERGRERERERERGRGREGEREERERGTRKKRRAVKVRTVSSYRLHCQRCCEEWRPGGRGS